MCWTWKKLITLGSSWYTSNFKRLITRMLNEKWIFRMNWFLVNSLWVYIDINQSSSEFIPNCLIQIVVLSYFITTLVTNGMFLAPRGLLVIPATTHPGSRGWSNSPGWSSEFAVRLVDWRGRYDVWYLQINFPHSDILPCNSQQFDAILTFQKVTINYLAMWNYELNEKNAGNASHQRFSSGILN